MPPTLSPSLRHSFLTTSQTTSKCPTTINTCQTTRQRSVATNTNSEPMISKGSPDQWTLLWCQMNSRLSNLRFKYITGRSGWTSRTLNRSCCDESSSRSERSWKARLILINRRSNSRRGSTRYRLLTYSRLTQSSIKKTHFPNQAL